VHVHAPAGAQPKDGPSAGITIAAAIISIASGRPVSHEVAMTGEITLSGQVLQIGGVREKVLAAQRAGVKKVVLPRENQPDLAELPDEAREGIEFVLVDSVEEVLEVVFDGSLPARRRRASVLPGRKAASAA
jgi:ATP-dependent Lon protease